MSIREQRETLTIDIAPTVKSNLLKCTKKQKASTVISVEAFLCFSGKKVIEEAFLQQGQLMLRQLHYSAKAFFAGHVQ